LKGALHQLEDQVSARRVAAYKNANLQVRKDANLSCKVYNARE